MVHPGAVEHPGGEKSPTGAEEDRLSIEAIVQKKDATKEVVELPQLNLAGPSIAGLSLFVKVFKIL